MSLEDLVRQETKAQRTFLFNDVSKDLTKEIEKSTEEYYSDKNTDLREKTRKQESYTVPEYDPNAPENMLTEHERKYGLKSIRDTIRDVFKSYRSQDVFDKYDAITGKTVEAERKVPLHHALGTKLTANGERVLKIDCAGSGFTYFRSQHKGFKGKGKAPDSDLFRKVFGDKIAGRFKKGIFKKERTLDDGKKLERYNLSGPHGLDAGDFTVSDIRNYVFHLGADYLKKAFTDSGWSGANPPPMLNINIQGHSRGGVAVSLGIKDLMQWIEGSYPQFKDRIKINMLLLDPVPGADNFTGDKVDLREFSDQVNATTICSMYTEHNVLQFTPQEVRGQARIILGNEKHSVRMDSADASQKDANGEIKVHKMAYFDSKTGEAYRGSGLAELPKGVFMQDENGILVRMRSYAQARQIHRTVRAGNKSELARANVIDTMLKNWFIDNEYVDETETDTEYAEEKVRVNGVMESLLDNSWAGRDSDEMKAVKDGIREVQAARVNADLSKEEKEAVYVNAIVSCKIYMLKKNPDTPSGKERMDKVSDILSQFRAELSRIKNNQFS